MAPQAVHHAKYVNVVVITGTVLQTPELRSTASGRASTTRAATSNCARRAATDVGNTPHGVDRMRLLL
jgi:hypothetical protein